MAHTYLSIVTPYNNFFGSSFLPNTHEHCRSGTADGGLTGDLRFDSVSFGACLLVASGLDIQPTMEQRDLAIGQEIAETVSIGNLLADLSLNSFETAFSKFCFVDEYVELGEPANAPEGSLRYNNLNKTVSYQDSFGWWEFEIE